MPRARASAGTRPGRPLLLLLLVVLSFCSFSRPASAFSFLGLLGMGVHEEAPTEERDVLSFPAVSHESYESGVVLSSAAHPRFAPPPSLLDAQASNVKALLSHSVTVHECRGATVDAVYAQCNPLTSESRQRIAVSLTECHLATSSHMQVHSCQDESVLSLSRCVKDMNRDPVVLSSYTSFATRIPDICAEVDRDFGRKQAQSAVNDIISATIETARAMKSMQDETSGMTLELKRAVETSSSSLKAELSRLGEQESARFDVLSSKTGDIASAQDSVLENIVNQTAHLKALLHDAEGLQALIKETGGSIEAAQRKILDIQQQAALVGSEAHQKLLTLSSDQKEGFEHTMQSLLNLQSLQQQLALAQEKGTAALESLSTAQRIAFDQAADRLAALSSEQAASFQKSHDAMADLSGLQEQIATEQGSILGHVKQSGEELRRLSDAQRESFQAASGTIASIRAQALEAQEKLQTMLGELHRVAQQLLGINIDMLSQLFRIESALFYVAFAPVVYLLTSTDRTHGARFWVFTLLLCALLFELNLVAAAQRFNIHLTQLQFDALRANVRYGLSVLSLLVLALSALLHRDYAALSYDLAHANTRVLHNSHRMLHELLRRTEQSASPPPSAASFQAQQQQHPPAGWQPNPFQSKWVPLHAGEEGEQQEGVPNGYPSRSPRTHQRLASSAASWHDLDTHHCCPDHVPTPGLLKRVLSFSKAAAAGTPTGTFSPAASPSHSRGFSFSHSSTTGADDSPTTHRYPSDEDEQTPQQHEQEEGSSSRDRSPSPYRARAPAAPYARITRSHSRSRSASQVPDERVVAARQAATPQRKSAGGRMMQRRVEEEGEGEEKGAEGRHLFPEEAEPGLPQGEGTPTRQSSRKKKGKRT